MAKTGRRRGGKSRGWGIPFPKVARKPGGFSQATEGPRTDDDIQRLQQEWVTRYTERVRAHRLLGVSMGTPLEDIEASHRLLVAHLLPGDPRRWKLDQALQLVQATAEAGPTERHDGRAQGAAEETGETDDSSAASDDLTHGAPAGVLETDDADELEEPEEPDHVEGTSLDSPG